MLISGTVRLWLVEMMSCSATAMLSMVVIPVNTLWTGLGGGWHGTLALALVEEVVAEGKGFQFFG